MLPASKMVEMALASLELEVLSQVVLASAMLGLERFSALAPSVQ